MESLLGQLQASLAGRYEIERELGSGGMAIVYLARDFRHDRRVALKVFRPELAAAVGAERFLREIHITAQLQHPNILPLYDSGEAGGFLFYVMPFIEGESLADLLRREPQLPLAQAVQIAREVAEALSVAHSHGIVHRDIKPQNIMLTGGHAVVADFGIARAVAEAGADQLTQTGMAIGTPAYMSPEQASGTEHVDARTDVYGLGCVLYEMLVGQPPFTGSTAQAIMARHSMEDVPALHIVRRSIPPDLEQVVLCALEKSPADRFHTASEFADALRAIASGETPHLTGSMLGRARRRWPRWARPAALAAGTVLGATAVAVIVLLVKPRAVSPPITGGLDPHNLAVLYFDDRSPGGTLAYVSDGLTEGLIDELAGVPGLHVISRNGAARFRDEAVPPESVARALDVGTLVRGSVEPVADRLRISLRLVEGSSGVDFDRVAFEVPANDPLAARDSVVGQAARMIRERLGEELHLRQERGTAPSGAAWALLQRGELERKLGEEAVTRGSLGQAFKHFVTADSLLAAAETGHPGWVSPTVLRGQIAYRRSRTDTVLDTVLAAIAAAVSHANRALTSDPNYPPALELRGTAQYWHWLLGVTSDPKQAETMLGAARADLEAAVHADPALASAHSTLSHLYYQTGGKGGMVSSLLEARLAYEADAFLATAPEVLWRLFLVSYDLEQLTPARTWCDEGTRRFPQDFRFAECRLWTLTMPAVTRDPGAAWRLVEEATRLAPESKRAYEHARTMIIAAAVLAQAGLADSARHVLLAARVGADVDPQQELPFVEAYVRTVLGDSTEAVALLKQLVAGSRHEAGSDAGEWATNWWWRGLRGRPDFEALVQASR
jgi:eukaryotic-like serine/threonine-protein kinase